MAEVVGHTWWAKPTSSASSGGATSAGTCSVSKENATMVSCCGLSRLIRKLKRRSKMLCPSSQQSSLQCRYDPLSYSLNFDATGSGAGGLVDDDYYKFYAFSSRFVATPRNNDCQRLANAASS